jgi:large subunit ribosomal protein L24
MKLKKGDNIIVLAGKDKGKKGKIVRSLPKMSKVIVEGINVSKKHQRPRRSNEKGSVVDTAMPIHVSNVKLAK